jgi:segregation and condensation protein A
VIQASQSPSRGSFTLSVPAFEGTIDELLALVAQNKLAPEDISLSGMAAQLSAFLEMDAANDLELEEAGRLVAAVARLAVRKSAQLLVQPLDADLDAEQIRPARHALDRAALRDAVARLVSREGLESFSPIAVPHLVERQLAPRPAGSLPRAWAEMHSRAARARALVAIPAFVRLETAVSGLVRRLRAQARVSLRRLLDGADRHEAVVHFLAVLELVRRRQAVVAQSELFEDIVVEYVESGDAEASRAG